MDLAAVFLLSLLGGYSFAMLWRGTAYSTGRVDGHHLYFRAALYGIVFFVIAFGLRAALLRWWPGYDTLDLKMVDFLRPALKSENPPVLGDEMRRAGWLLTAGYSLLVGPICAGLLNTFTSQHWALTRALGPLDLTLLDAQKSDMPVALTLSNGKVYVGLVISTTDPGRTPAAVRLLPMVSGYRDSLQRLVLTTDYQKTYSALQGTRAQELALPDNWLSLFTLAIRADMIVTATLFSPAVYGEFNPDWKQKIANLDQPPAPQQVVVELKRPALRATPASGAPTSK